MAANKYANPSDPRRRSERHQVDALQTNLGTIVDLSSVGLRLQTSSKPPFKLGEIRKITLHLPEGKLVLTGRAVWIQRIGLRKHQCGIELLNVSKNMATGLDNLGRFGFLAGADNGPASTSGRKKSKRKKETVQASVSDPDYYDVLGIPKQASVDEVRDAYRELARQLHPDVTDDPKGPEKFIVVQQAYEILRDARRRQEYDRKSA